MEMLVEDWFGLEKESIITNTFTIVSTSS